MERVRVQKRRSTFVSRVTNNLSRRILLRVPLVLRVSRPKANERD